MKKERGFILITLYLLLVILLAHGTALVTRSFAEIKGAERFQSTLQAFYLAEGGVDWAITQLQNNPLWAGGAQNVAAGSYTVALVDLGGNRRRLTSQGTVNQGIPANQFVEAIVLVTPSPLFPYAMFGDQSVRLTGNARTDSYDSRIGPYSVATAGTDGDVGTNGTSAGNVTLTGNASVNGDAFVGTGGDPNTVITRTGNSTITGNQSALNAPQTMTPVTIPGGLVNQGNRSISGNNNVILPGGTYLYTNLSVSGNGRLSFSGPAIVYLTGTLSISGNGIGTAANLPPNLVFHVKGSGNVSFTGNADFYGAVYAPESPVQISGNGAFYGGTAGRTVTNTGNGGVHYDEALRNAGGGSGSQVQFLSWRDLSE